MQPFGRNRYGPKIGWGLCPFGGRGAGSPSNTVWPGPRPTCTPSFVLIRPTVWPQCTNVADRQTGQTDRQRTDSIGRTVLQTVAQKRLTKTKQQTCSEQQGVETCQKLCRLVQLLKDVGNRMQWPRFDDFVSKKPGCLVADFIAR